MGNDRRRSEKPQDVAAETLSTNKSLTREPNVNLADVRLFFH